MTFGKSVDSRFISSTPSTPRICRDERVTYAEAAAGKSLSEYLGRRGAPEIPCPHFEGEARFELRPDILLLDAFGVAETILDTEW
jgi:hypothetical protein